MSAIPMSPLQDTLARRLEVEDAVVHMFVATDRRDWPAVESSFTDPFMLDMTSMVGGTSTAMTPRQVANAWADGFLTLDHVHHQVGNFQITVTGDTAAVRCYGLAFHHRAGIAAPVKSRLFVGDYEIDLVAQVDRWRISRLKFNLKFIDGNAALEKAT